MYQTIVADPPWEVKAGRPLGNYKMVDGKQLFSGDSDAARPLEYPSMSVEAICNLPIGTLAGDNAHLYLWTINKYIEEAFEVARRWGFRYSTMLTWAKNPMGSGLGGTYGISTEHVLFCRRGSLATREDVNTTWFNWKRPYFNGAPRHSAKPDDFMRMVERVSPGPYLEVFARENRPGWAAFGNECARSIELT